MRRNEATLDRSRAERRHGRGVWRGVFLSEERERERERDRIGIGIWISRSEKKERKKERKLWEKLSIFVGVIIMTRIHHTRMIKEGRKEGRKKQKRKISYHTMVWPIAHTLKSPSSSIAYRVLLSIYLSTLSLVVKLYL